MTEDLPAPHLCLMRRLTLNWRWPAEPATAQNDRWQSPISHRILRFRILYSEANF
jgi:hypothetical protein